MQTLMVVLSSICAALAGDPSTTWEAFAIYTPAKAGNNVNITLISATYVVPSNPLVDEGSTPKWWVGLQSADGNGVRDNSSHPLCTFVAKLERTLLVRSSSSPPCKGRRSACNTSVTSCCCYLCNTSVASCCCPFDLTAVRNTNGESHFFRC